MRRRLNHHLALLHRYVKEHETQQKFESKHFATTHLHQSSVNISSTYGITVILLFGDLSHQYIEVILYRAPFKVLSIISPLCHLAQLAS